MGRDPHPHVLQLTTEQLGRPPPHRGIHIQQPPPPLHQHVPIQSQFWVRYDPYPRGQHPQQKHPLRLALLKKLHEWCSLWITQAQGHQKKAYDNNKRSNKEPLREGDRMWISSQDLSTDWPSPKLEALRFGPYTIKEVMGPLTYKVQTSPHWRVNRTFHRSKLTLVEPAITRQPTHITNPTTIEQTPYIGRGGEDDNETPNPNPTAGPRHNAHRQN